MSMTKTELFTRDFKAIQGESARYAWGKLRKYKNQRLSFQATNLVQNFLKGLEKVPPYKPSMRIEGIFAGIYKEPVSIWTIELRKVIFTDGDVRLIDFGNMKMGWDPQKLFGGQREVNKADGF